MSAESEIYAALTADATLTALVGTRIYPDALPEDGEFPAIVYMREDSNPQYAISGEYYGSFVTIGIQAWAQKRSVSNAVGVAAINAMMLAGMQHDSRKVGYDPEVGLFATVIGIDIFEQPVLGAGVGGIGLLTEAGDSLVTEDGDQLIIEDATATALQTEGGDTLVTEDGDRITI